MKTKSELFEPAWPGAPFLAGVVMDANAGQSVEDMEAEIEDLRNELQEILALGEDEMSDEDVTRLGEIEASVNRKVTMLNAKRQLQNRRSRGRRTEPRAAPANEPGRRPGDPVPAQPRNEAEEKRHGFKAFGEFAMTVLNAGMGNGSAIERMENVATTYSTEQVGADGGFLVPPEFRQEIWRKVRGEDSLMSRTTEFVTSKNSLTFPKDETAPWDNSSGIQIYWEGEGEQLTASKAKFEMQMARLKKLTALVNVSEELMDDAVGLESYLRVMTPIKMVARINTAIVAGTGVGQPQGILNAPSLVTVTKEASQDADSILMPNINKMWNRLYAPLRSNAVWLINQEIEPQLEGMQFLPANEHGTSTAGFHQPVYLPAGGLADTPFARLKGRPVIPVQAAKQLGDLGDIILTDLTQYMTLTKGQGIQEDVSMHLYFDQALQTFRWIFRLMGQPMWNSVISPENGSNTYSWAVVLEERA